MTDSLRKRRLKRIRTRILKSNNEELILLKILFNRRPINLSLRRENEADWISVEDMLRSPYQAGDLTGSSHVYDMGANIATFALLAMAHLPDVALTCYEVDENNFSILKRNLEQNGFRADLRQRACWKEDGVIYYHEATSNTGYVDGIPPGVEIPCELPVVIEDSWVKMDIEGSEFEVLPALLKKKERPACFSIEVHWVVPHKVDIVGLLESAGYVPDIPLDESAVCQEINFLRKIDRIQP